MPARDPFEDADPPPDAAGSGFAYQLRLCIEPGRAERAWRATLDGRTPDGHALERREFGSLMDLMRFIEAFTQGRGLR